ncbi:MAG: hypothetical protein NTY19_48415 [Planctomycetota bacterium]|nr:hypothetical protein [Planctomycetota bacterium]
MNRIALPMFALLSLAVVASGMPGYNAAFAHRVAMRRSRYDPWH